MKIPKELKCKNCYFYYMGQCTKIIEGLDIDYDYVLVEPNWYCGYFLEVMGEEKTK
jgi:hypothetical protein